LNGGEQAVLEVAQGISSPFTKQVSEQDKKAIIDLYQKILKVNDVSACNAKELHA
jgi:hypothetical protein